MRHGRKSKSKRFDGYKQHVSTDLETDLVLACAVTPRQPPPRGGGDTGAVGGTWRTWASSPTSCRSTART